MLQEVEQPLQGNSLNIHYLSDLVSTHQNLFVAMLNCTGIRRDCHVAQNSVVRGSFDAHKCSVVTGFMAQNRLQNSLLREEILRD